MDIYSHYVYWIHFLEHDDYSNQGYIGVSSNPTRRFKQHLSTSELRIDKNPYFSNILKKYPEKIVQTIIFQGHKQACYMLEEELRPYKNIGWNNNKGGSSPPSKIGWKPSTHTLEKRSNSLKNIIRSECWRNNLSLSKLGDKNGMFGKYEPCSEKRKIAIIISKHETRINSLIEAYQLLKNGFSIRCIAKTTGYSPSFILNLKHNFSLYVKAFPILEQFETS